MPVFLRLPFVSRGQPVEIYVDGRPLVAYEGESLAAALLTRSDDFSRSCKLFCGMGACFGCRVTVDGVPNVRSCVTLARPGLRVEVPKDADD